MSTHVIPLDLLYMGLPGAIGAYLVRNGDAAVLVEAGPANTIEHLEQALGEQGLRVEDLDACCVTHIHLDHAGAAGCLAQRGVPIHVHAFGAKHLVDPTKLLASASRIYGAGMRTLWGRTVPVPADMIRPVEDRQVIKVGNMQLEAIETPGHARHHHAFQLQVDDELVCFCGDAAAMLLPDTTFISVPMPPPEFDLATWLQTIELLRNGPWSRLLLTHGGIVTDIDGHLDRFVNTMTWQVEFVAHAIDDGTDEESLLKAYRARLATEASGCGVQEAMFAAFVTENLLGMNISGVRRWHAQQLENTP